jgi:hypothetical protein
MNDNDADVSCRHKRPIVKEIYRLCSESVLMSSRLVTLVSLRGYPKVTFTNTLRVPEVTQLGYHAGNNDVTRVHAADGLVCRVH